MATQLRRVIRAGVTLAGMVALGATLATGTAFAADTPSIPDVNGAGHHGHHGSGEPYDYDLYQPSEHYDANECGDAGDRHPIGATENGLGGFNGDSDDDCDYGDDDYDPERTGFQRDPDDDYGYNGYVGSDSSRDDQTYTTVRGSERESEDDDDDGYEFDEGNATRDAR